MVVGIVERRKRREGKDVNGQEKKVRGSEGWEGDKGKGRKGAACT